MNCHYTAYYNLMKDGETTKIEGFAHLSIIFIRIDLDSLQITLFEFLYLVPTCYSLVKFHHTFM